MANQKRRPDSVYKRIIDGPLSSFEILFTNNMLPHIQQCIHKTKAHAGLEIDTRKSKEIIDI